MKSYPSQLNDQVIALHLTNHNSDNWSATTQSLKQASVVKVFQLIPNCKKPLDVNHVPTVIFAMSQTGTSLALSYFITKDKGLVLPTSDIKNYHRKDFLWESDCLELFIELNHEQRYFEINCHPNGAFNVYSFDNYRLPDVMPPRQDKHIRVSYLFNPTYVPLTNWYQSYINVQLNHYFKKFADRKPYLCRITKINPCVILYQNNEPIYYATDHSNPPDFHNKQNWLDF